MLPIIASAVLFKEFENFRYSSDRDDQCLTATSANSGIHPSDEPENQSALKVKIAVAKLRIVNFWKYKLTQRKLDMIIGGVYFFVILLYAVIFFSSLK